jgi:hypothetical protein
MYERNNSEKQENTATQCTATLACYIDYGLDNDWRMIEDHALEANVGHDE